MTGDLAIRRGTAAVVLAVAAFAAVVSYSHIYDLGRAHGQSGTAARLLPLSVDGLILAASLVMLHAASTGGPVRLARCMLALGVAATGAANVLYGLGYGVLGAVISAWPAVAFIGAAEMALGMVRAASQIRHAVSDSAPIDAPLAVTPPGTRQRPPGEPAPASEYGGTSVPAPHPNGHSAPSWAFHPGVPSRPAGGQMERAVGTPEGAPDAARLFAAELARGELPSIRRIRREVHCGQDRAQSIAAYLAALAPVPVKGVTP